MSLSCQRGYQHVQAGHEPHSGPAAPCWACCARGVWQVVCGCGPQMAMQIASHNSFCVNTICVVQRVLPCFSPLLAIEKLKSKHCL